MKLEKLGPVGPEEFASALLAQRSEVALTFEFEEVAPKTRIKWIRVPLRAIVSCA